MSIGPIGSRLAASQSKVLIGDALSSGLESIKSGISEATQKGGLASIKDAVQLFDQGKPFSSSAARKFRRTPMAKFGHANPPHHFFKQLASAKGVPFGKFQPREMAQKLADPSLRMQEGLKGLASNIQTSMASIQQQIQASSSGAPKTAPSTSDPISSKNELNEHIEKLEGELQSVGDDAQLANVDLQNILQKQQQTMQMMSNMSKMLHDTSSQIMRKLGG